MTVEYAKEVLLWCTLINFGVLIVWWLGFMLAHDWIYHLHTKWFNIGAKKFDAIHYAGMMYYKMAIFLFVFVPYLALLIAG
ncbi:MAG: hypothetical protein O7G85_15145 [Planctomycetota bacterium]|nr:hypothetical protein [Planctomycetota bacterium]